MLIVSVFNFLKSPGSDLKEKEEAFFSTSHLVSPTIFCPPTPPFQDASPLKSMCHPCPPKKPSAGWVVSPAFKVEHFAGIFRRPGKLSNSWEKSASPLLSVQRQRKKSFRHISKIYVYLSLEWNYIIINNKTF